MTKAPAFQFYPKDFLSDESAIAMGLDERGAYITLICFCWIEGSIPSDIRRLARLVGVERKRMDALWPAVAPCFEPDPDHANRLLHPRLEKEREKQRVLADKRRNAAMQMHSKRDANALQKLCKTPALQFASASAVKEVETNRPNGKSDVVETSSAPPGRGDGWSRRACDAWIAQYGGTAPGGRIGKALKPLIKKHGPEPVLKAWADYLSERDPQYASAQEFAGKYGLWSGNDAKLPPKEDESPADKRARVETQLVAQWLEDHPAERAEIETWAEKLADEKRYPQDGRRRSFVQFNVAGAVKRRLRLTA